MLDVLRHGVVIASVATLTEAETAVADSGEVMEAAWGQIVPLGLQGIDRIVWRYEGWAVVRFVAQLGEVDA